MTAQVVLFIVWFIVSWFVSSNFISAPVVMTLGWPCAHRVSSCGGRAHRHENVPGCVTLRAGVGVGAVGVQAKGIYPSKAKISCSLCMVPGIVQEILEVEANGVRTVGGRDKEYVWSGTNGPFGANWRVRVSFISFPCIPRTVGMYQVPETAGTMCNCLNSRVGMGAEKLRVIRLDGLVAVGTRTELIARGFEAMWDFLEAAPAACGAARTNNKLPTAHSQNNLRRFIGLSYYANYRVNYI